jgi:exodeoxyribonuclease-3
MAVCLQETRASKAELQALELPRGFCAYWNVSGRLGYSGTGIITRIEPMQVIYGLDVAGLDDEGRVLTAVFRDFALVSCYMPNGNRSPARLSYKLRFAEALIQFCRRLRRRHKRVMICGDMNVAHTELDLARPGPNRTRSGFLPEERAYVDGLLAAGFVDTLRHFHPNVDGLYTWWSWRRGCRERNHGWRYDYVFASRETLPSVTSPLRFNKIAMSAHCPVGIRVEFPSIGR